MKALIVDDSLVVRTIIGNTVKEMGYDALQAGNGKEAMELLSEHGDDVELMLLDWNMPVQDGYETVTKIRKIEKYNNLCILMVSTESEDKKVGEALASGANGYLAKPFEREELTSKIKATLAEFRSR